MLICKNKTKKYKYEKDNQTSFNHIILFNQYGKCLIHCDQKQVRTNQAREKDELSNSIRNVGSAITETQTIKVSSSRSVVGSKPKDEVCMFGGGKAYWLESAGTTKIIWYSDNVEVSFPSGPTTYTYNGYEYIRGTYSSIKGNPSVGYTAFYYAYRS